MRIARGRLLTAAALAVAALAVQFWAAAQPGADLAPPDGRTYETWFRGGTIVTFDHRLHSEYLGATCGDCHHLEPCDRCHQSQAGETIVRSSRVALHDACFRCHAQEPGGEGCGDCHRPPEDATIPGGVAASPAMGRAAHEQLLAEMAEHAEGLDMIGERFPHDAAVREPPEDHIFVTGHEGISTVGFPHKIHSEDYGLACTECHHLERCDLCHGRMQQRICVASAVTAVRDNCVNCHDDLGLPTDCEQCHTEPHTR